MTSNLDFSSDGFLDLGFDQRDSRCPFSTNKTTHSACPAPLNIASEERQESSPGHNEYQQFQLEHNAAPTLLVDWPIQQQSQQLPQYMQDKTLMKTQFDAFEGPFQRFPLDYHLPSTEAALEVGLPMEAPFNGLAQTMDAQAGQWASWHGFESVMDSARAHDTLPIHSDSSQSDGSGYTMESFGGFKDLSYPCFPVSADSDNYLDLTREHGSFFYGEAHHPSHESVSPATAVAPVPTKALSNQTPILSTLSPPAVVLRMSNGKNDIERRGGKRRGPLSTKQRKQASEVRKLRACLRCKFLKKTCDKGEPCAGCQPSYARFWQAPCTRVDIKDIGYFMKDWKVDYKHHVGHGMSIHNIKGFSQKEGLIWITFGFGIALPVVAREVYVRDDSCFYSKWSEPSDNELVEFKFRTDRLSIGSEGISVEALSEYLDKHIDAIDGPFERMDGSFERAPFIAEILKTTHRYYMKEKVPVIRKALKFTLAYNFMFRISEVEQYCYKHSTEGPFNNQESKYNGKVITPAMINSQIKCLLADIWRKLQKEILEELSTLYSSVYSGDKLKNWPTIFMLTSILLYVWEEMQFDSYKCGNNEAAADRFCNDMETTPVNVIVGLFNTISQRLPALTKWEKRSHGQLFDNNAAVCDAMAEMRGHITKHKSYLKTRYDAKFDRRDMCCLSNKFLSRLIIRTD